MGRLKSVPRSTFHETIRPTTRKSTGFGGGVGFGVFLPDIIGNIATLGTPVATYPQTLAPIGFSLRWIFVQHLVKDFLLQNRTVRDTDRCSGIETIDGYDHYLQLQRGCGFPHSERSPQSTPGIEEKHPQQETDTGIGWFTPSDTCDSSPCDFLAYKQPHLQI